MKNAILLTLREGGLTLAALIVLAVMIYSLGTAIWWRSSHLQQIIRRMDGPDAANPLLTEHAFAQFELAELAWVDRRLPFLAVLTAAAPLLGLLGTVAGMLTTFAGMAESGPAAPVDSVSAGISKALVTTQAGLVIAIPASFLLALLHRRSEATHLVLRRQLHSLRKQVAR